MFRLLVTCLCLGALEAVPCGAPVTVPLVKYHREGYQTFYLVVSVGTPPQTMRMSFDMSTGDSFLPSSRCETKACLTRSRYDSATSSTYQANGTPYDVGYGQNISGSLSTDTVSMAGLDIEGQTFGEITQLRNQWYLKLPNDGSMGLGRAFTSPALNATPTVLDNMVTQGLIPRRELGLWLGPSGGELTLGGIREDRYTGNLTTVPIHEIGAAWYIDVDGIELGDQSGDLCGNSSCQALAIAASPYFVLSYEQAAMLNKRIGASPMFIPGYYVLDCTQLHKLPPLTFTIGGRKFEMSGFDYTVVHYYEGRVQQCSSGFLGAAFPEENNQWLMGDLFMQKFYTTYNWDNKTVGIADSV